eukprot:33180-Pyramimonas_sp.AAC.1
MDQALWTDEDMMIDQEGGLTGDMASLFCDRYSVTREFGGAAANAHPGLAERAVSLVNAVALKIKANCVKQGITCLSDDDIVAEAAMVGNLTLNCGGSVPAQELFGHMPKDACDPESKTLTSTNSILVQ